MRVDLLPASDVATYVVFDPAAVPHLVRAHDESDPSTSRHYQEIDRQSELGNLLVYYDVGDGDLRIRLYIDEPPEPHLAPFTRLWLQNSLLRAPSGRLFGMGAEYLPADAPDATPDTYPPRKNYLGSTATIPPGVYALTAYDVDWASGAIESRIDEEIGPHAAALKRRYDTQTGCGCALTTAYLILLLVAALAPSLRHAGWPTWAPVALLGLALAAYWFQWNRFGKKHSVRAALDLHAQASAKWPSLVLVLTKLDDADIPPAFPPARLEAESRHPTEAERH